MGTNLLEVNFSICNLLMDEVDGRLISFYFIHSVSVLIRGLSIFERSIQLPTFHLVEKVEAQVDRSTLASKQMEKSK